MDQLELVFRLLVVFGAYILYIYIYIYIYTHACDPKQSRQLGCKNSKFQIMII